MPPSVPPSKSPPSFSIPDDEEDDVASPPKAAPAGAVPLPSTHRRDPHMRLPHFTSITSNKRSGPKSPSAGHQGDDEDSPSSDEDEHAAFYAAASSAPQTPNISETAAQLRRSLSVHGLHQLSSMPPQQLRKSVGNKVWRPHDEQARLPGDWERLAVHVFRGGLRAFNLAYGLRATLMLVLAFIKGLRKRKVNGKELRGAAFSAENWRFALMFGIWAGLYKTVHNSLRLMTPLPPLTGKRTSRSASQPVAGEKAGQDHLQQQQARAAEVAIGDEENRSNNGGSGAATSGVNTPRSGYHELAGKTDEEKLHVKSQQKRRAFMRDPRSKIWHAYVAGAVSSLAVLAETKSNRISLAQQLFVRGLEGSYNVAHAKGKINIPHGAVLAFGLACGQIMYAWLNAPETLPRGYVNWITNASMVTPRVTPIHRDIAYGRKPDVDSVVKHWFPGGVLPDPIKVTSAGREIFGNTARTPGNRRGMTARNTTKIVEWVKRVRAGGDPGAYIPCFLVHPWEDSHFFSPLDRFVEVTRWILPVYLTLHFVPALFLRTGAFMKSPLRVLLRSIFGAVRSSSFLGVFVIIFQTLFCEAHQLHDLLAPIAAGVNGEGGRAARAPKWLLSLLSGSYLHWAAGFATCASLFVDHARRRAELAAYVLPKGMESAWSVARKRGWAPFVPGGDLLLTSAGMALVMGTYARSPEHLSGLVRRIVYQFIGRN